MFVSHVRFQIPGQGMDWGSGQTVHVMDFWKSARLEVIPCCCDIEFPGVLCLLCITWFVIMLCIQF